MEVQKEEIQVEVLDETMHVVPESLLSFFDESVSTFHLHHAVKKKMPNKPVGRNASQDYEMLQERNEDGEKAPVLTRAVSPRDADADDHDAWMETIKRNMELVSNRKVKPTFHASEKASSSVELDSMLGMPPEINETDNLVRDENMQKVISGLRDPKTCMDNLQGDYHKLDELLLKTVAPRPIKLDRNFSSHPDSLIVLKLALQALFSMKDIKDSSIVKEKDQIELLRRAFHVTKFDIDKLVTDCLDRSKLDKDLHHIFQWRNSQILSHYYYRKEAFPSMTEFNQFSKSHESNVKNGLKKTEKNLEEQKRLRAKKASGEVSFSFCSCLGPPAPAIDVIEPEEETQSNLEWLVDEQGVLKTDFHSLIELLLLVLFEECNSNTLLLVADKSDNVHQPFTVLNDDAEWILHQWCVSFGISEAYYYLLYFRILLFHPRTCAEYFEKMTDILNIITQEPSKNNNAPYYPFTVSEKEIFMDMLRMAYKWGNSCLNSYHQAFFCGKPVGALESCLKLLKLCHDTLIEFKDTRFISELNFEAYLKASVSISTQNRFSALIEETSEAVASKENDIQSTAAEFGIECPFRNCEHLLSIFEQILIDLDENKLYFAQAFEVVSPGFPLNEIAGQIYFNVSWGYSQIFLRLEADRGIFVFLIIFLILDRASELSVVDRPLDPYLWLLYSTMKKFVKELAPFVKLPTVSITDWFEPFTERWIAKKEVEFLNNYLPNIIQLENKFSWRMLKLDDGSSLFSQSVIDVFTFLYSTTSAFKLLSHSNGSTLTFVRMILNVVENYVNKVQELLYVQVESLAASATVDTPWGLGEIKDNQGRAKNAIAFSYDFITKINDIRIMKKRLADLFRHEAIKAEFDRSFSFIQALTMKANQIRNLVSDNEDDNAEVSQSVKIDNTYIDDVAGQIAQSVHHWVSAQIASAIRLPKKEDPDVVIDAQLIEDRSRHLWQYLLLLFKDPANKSNVPLVGVLYTDLSLAIGRKLLDLICGDLELLVLPNADDFMKCLSAHQFSRATVMIELLKQYFCYDFSFHDLASTPLFHRLEIILGTLSESSEELIDIYNALPDYSKSKIDKRELERLRKSEPPYISRQHVLTLLRFRAKKCDDKIAERFVHQHQSVLSNLADVLRF